MFEGMEVRKLIDYCHRDTIYAYDSQAWELVAKALKDIDHDVLLDATDVFIADVWRNEGYKVLLENPHIYLKVFNRAKLAYHTELVCELSAFKTGRIWNIEPEIVKTVEKPDVKRLELREQLNGYTDVGDNWATIRVKDRFEELTSHNMVTAIKDVTADLIPKGINQIVVDVGNMFASQPVLSALVDFIVESNTLGVTVTVKSDKQAVIEATNLFSKVKSAVGVGLKDKMSIVKSKLPKKAPCLLIAYKASRKADEYGRYGKGEALWCRISLYLGVKKGNNGKPIMVFRTYNRNTFFTRQHWACENDNELLEELESSVINVPLDQTGFMDEFVGSHFHVSAPIQYSKKKNRVYIVEDGKMVSMDMLLPEMIAHVMDDWEIEYDKAFMAEAIRANKEVLGEFK